MDATNPRILYAAMWEHGRLPWQVISGGPGSGLYKSTDTGETWEKMTEGLPEEMGKMAIAVSRSNPETVYALIESDSAKDERGLYVSDQRRQDVEPGDERSPPDPARLVLHRALRRSEGRAHDLRAERARAAVDRRRQDLADAVGHARRFPRPVDQPRQSAQLHHRERRRRGDHLRRGQELEHAGARSRRRSSTGSTSTTGSRTASTAASRTTRRSSSRAASWAAGASPRRAGRRRPAARARSWPSTPTIRATCWAAATRARSR